MQDWTKRAASTTQWRERALRKQPWFRWRWGRDAPELICLAQLQPIQRQFPSCPLLHRRATVLQGLWKSILWSSPSCSCPHQSCQIFLVVETLLKCPAVYATKVLSPPLQRAFSPPCCKWQLKHPGGAPWQDKRWTIKKCTCQVPVWVTHSGCYCCCQHKCCTTWLEISCRGWENGFLRKEFLAVCRVEFSTNRLATTQVEGFLAG